MARFHSARTQPTSSATRVESNDGMWPAPSTMLSRLVDAGVGVTTLETYELKRIDEDYFAEVE